MNDNQAKIVIAGFGGQGIVLIGNVLARACVIEDKNVVGMVSYGAEMRGGTANATVIISDDEIASPFVVNPTHAIILNNPSLDRFEPELVSGGMVLLNSSMMQRSLNRHDLDCIHIDATETAHAMKNLRVANIVALGAFIQHTGLVSVASAEQGLKDLFGQKKANLIDINLQALHAGAEKSRLERAVDNATA